MKTRKLYLTKKQKYIVGISIAAFILIVSAIYTVFILPKLNEEKWTYMESQVISGDMTIGVTESGALDYGETEQVYDIDLDFSEDEDEEEDEEDEEATEKYLKVEDVYIVVGQRILEDDEILTFTEDSIEDVRKLLTAELTDAQIAYSEAKTEYDVSLFSADETYQTTLVSGDYASKIYSQSVVVLESNLTSKSYEIDQLTNEIETLSETIEEIYEDYYEAEETYNEAIAYFELADYSNIYFYVEAQTIFLNAEDAYEKAKTKYEDLLEDIDEKTGEIESLNSEIIKLSSELSLEKMESEHDYAMSIAEISVAESIYDISIAGLEESLLEAENDVEEAEEELEKFEEFVGNGTIYADGSGIVTSLSYEEGDYLIEEGSVFTFAKEDEMTITVDVSQEDVIDLAIDDEVSLSFLAYEDVNYSGIISSITTTVTSEDSATVSYPVVVSVLGDTSALYGGMTADITFVTETKEDTLYVSKSAIVEENDSYYVYISSGFGGYELKEVSVGITDGIYTEILDGVSAGDTIYVATMVAESATKTEISTDDELTDEEISDEGTEFEDMDMPMDMPEGMDEGDMPTGERPERMEDTP
jgi:HlyD family secretion protein